MDFRKPRPEDPEINLIPFIDVLLVILIFLMITTTYSRFTELQIQLPTADAERAQQRPREIVVSVSSRGVYSVNKQVMEQTVTHDPLTSTFTPHYLMTEGRKREVRRLLAAVGLPVTRLVRVRVGPIRLGRLKPGERRELTAEELLELQRAAAEGERRARRTADGGPRSPTSGM